ncbi:hypothetical protein AMTR_s00117p00028920 [Amborella trichopoda]|uniref:Uncharacterized protein n=1 Tax=Amborella trichopoda TaxID=13333 RepID=W1NP09_AMBTC|nr:hypothetical protein AMTR_s00117p00028920 [Amborella trichopoda]
MVAEVVNAAGDQERWGCERLQQGAAAEERRWGEQGSGWHEPWLKAGDVEGTAMELENGNDIGHQCVEESSVTGCWERGSGKEVERKGRMPSRQ